MAGCRVRFAYADPPYLGCCRLYEHHHPDGKCWDDIETHAALIEQLASDYPDGWALSAKSGSLQRLLPLCPDDVRIGAWVKPFCSFKPGVRPAYAWEPVIFWRGRNPNVGHSADRTAPTPRDFVSCNITLKKGLTGAKPEPVCDWILDFLGFQPGDEVDDLFPGTGVMSAVADARQATTA